MGSRRQGARDEKTGDRGNKGLRSAGEDARTTAGGTPALQGPRTPLLEWRLSTLREACLRRCRGSRLVEDLPLALNGFGAVAAAAELFGVAAIGDGVHLLAPVGA